MLSGGGAVIAVVVVKRAQMGQFDGRGGYHLRAHLADRLRSRFGPIDFVFLCSLGPIHFVEAESGTDTESFKIDAGAARTDRRRPRSRPDEAGENILTLIGFLFLCSLSWLICGGRWWVAGWVSGWVAVAGRGGFGWLEVVSVWV
uniref:Uncharacterized protein n=1 Tax=Fagus sylvatica TaxID=28930 RepID=A0A2N9EQH8_FAGSY